MCLLGLLRLLFLLLFTSFTKNLGQSLHGAQAIILKNGSVRVIWSEIEWLAGFIRSLLWFLFFIVIFLISLDFGNALVKAERIAVQILLLEVAELFIFIWWKRPMIVADSKCHVVHDRLYVLMWTIMLRFVLALVLFAL